MYDILETIVNDVADNPGTTIGEVLERLADYRIHTGLSSDGVRHLYLVAPRQAGGDAVPERVVEH